MSDMNYTTVLGRIARALESLVEGQDLAGKTNRAWSEGYDMGLVAGKASAPAYPSTGIPYRPTQPWVAPVYVGDVWPHPHGGGITVSTPNTQLWNSIVDDVIGDATGTFDHRSPAVHDEDVASTR